MTSDEEHNTNDLVREFILFLFLTAVVGYALYIAVP
jgi:hypothetical protein